MQKSYKKNKNKDRKNNKLDFRQQLGAIKNLPEFFRLIWRTDRLLTTSNFLLRIIRAAIPISLLYIGKLIIDEIVNVSGKFNGFEIQITEISFLLLLIILELGLAIFSDLLGRAIAMVDSLLGDLVSHDISMLLMNQSAKLDLECFEDPEFYDKLERARRQASSRILLISQSLTQLQDILTVFFLAAALITFNIWLLILLAVTLIPAFLGETHFNNQSYSLMYGWTHERRELDYLRFAGASDETAKEVKVFGLSNFFSSRYKKLAKEYYLENKKISIRRATWGGLLSIMGSIGYYLAYLL